MPTPPSVPAGADGATSSGRADETSAEQFPVDGGDALDGVPPADVVADPGAGDRLQTPRHRNLLGGAVLEGHGDVGGAVQATATATAAVGLPAAEAADEEAAAQHQVDGRQAGEQSSTLRDEVVLRHVLHLLNCRTTCQETTRVGLRAPTASGRPGRARAADPDGDTRHAAFCRRGGPASGGPADRDGLQAGEHRDDADRQGVRLTYRAGWDPETGMIEFLRLLDAKVGDEDFLGEVGSWFSSHPETQRRVMFAEEYLAEVKSTEPFEAYPLPESPPPPVEED